MSRALVKGKIGSDPIDVGLGPFHILICPRRPWRVFLSLVNVIDYPPVSNRIVDAKKLSDGLIEEMGLLHVSVTRARKAVYVSVSMQLSANYGNYQVACPSCLTSLPGIEPMGWEVMDGEE